VIDGHLPSLDRLPQHRELLERVFARFRDDIRALGLVLGGSLAQGGADFYSDVDLYVVVRDGAFEDVFAERTSTAEAVGSPLFGFAVDPVPGGSTDHIVVYDGPVKFDFMYLRESDLGPHPRWVGCVVLKDTRSRGSRRRPLGSTRATSTESGRSLRAEPEVLDLVLVRLRQDRAGRAVGSAGWSA
jgi:predicted nucleotidyltransferase